MTIIDIIQKIRTGHVDTGTEIVFTYDSWWSYWKEKVEIVRDTFRAARDEPNAAKVSKFIEERDKEFHK